MVSNNKKLIGFSSSFLHHTYPRASKEIIQMCKDMGCNALELNCSIEKFELMDKLEQDDLEPFKFVTFHLPPGISQKNLESLARVQHFHNKLRFNVVVVHPDIVKDWNILKPFNLPISVENMDECKKIGRTLKSMKEILFKNDYKVTLDINHCYCNDPTLKLADDLFNEFKDRISHFHLSGYEKRHEPLTRTKQTEFIDFVKDKDKPIIIESVCADLAEAKEEFNFIKDCLDK